MRKCKKRISTLYPLSSTLDSETIEVDGGKIRVAAYCRDSLSSEEQLSSYNIQIQYFKRYIIENPHYDLVDVYADEGISGTDIRKREAFNRLIDDARNNKIDMVITKSL